MAWKTIDFEGIVSLNEETVSHLHSYLDSKESQLAQGIIHSFPFTPSLEAPSIASPSSGMKLRLTDAIDAIGRQVRQINEGQLSCPSESEWNEIVLKINKLLWKDLEILEESVTELFQQLSLVGIEEWRIELSHAVSAIKELLIQRMDDLRWTVKRLNIQLCLFRTTIDSHTKTWFRSLRRLQLWWRPPVDRSIGIHLDKCQKYLLFNFQQFNDHYKRYVESITRVNHSLEKFSWYKVFSTLEPESQDKYKRLYRLIRLWEISSNSKVISRTELVRALRTLTSPERANALFREYYQALKSVMFEKSRLIKSNPELVMQAQSVYQMQDDFLGVRGELHSLASTIEHYRDFLLRTDPNPYVRSRVGFPEWITGQEPNPSKELHKLSYDVETLDSSFEAFRQAIDRKILVSDVTVQQQDSDVQDMLHEMIQPLISKGMMKTYAERLVNLLMQFDELSSTQPDVVEYIGRILGRALRADWKYHVLFDIPDFHLLYETHMGVLGPVEDRSHFNRMQRFKKHIQQIESWIKENSTSRHTSDIDLDMSDIKGYLQDFLAQVQRVSGNDVADRSIAQQVQSDLQHQLLEYRYLFASFFHRLRQERQEERILRRQFLFVDQYFESVENRLYEWHSSLQS